MKQFSESVHMDPKTAVKVVLALLILICILFAAPFTVAAFGEGFLPAESESDTVSISDYNALAAENQAMRKQIEAFGEITVTQADYDALKEQLAAAEAENAALVQAAAQAESATAELQGKFDLLLDNYSRKYAIVAKLVQDNPLMIPDDETRHILYVTAEEYARIQVGDILTSSPDLDFPTADSWSLTVINKYIAVLEGIE